MAHRIKLTEPVYMKLSGQPQLVERGSVIDVNDLSGLSGAHYTLLSPSEPARGLLPNNYATPVRTVRTR